MPESPPPQVDLCEFTKYLLFQQFYYGGDEIVGRAKDITVTIPGVGKTLDRFFNRVCDLIRLLDKENYMDFLQKFQANIYPISIQAISEQYASTLESLGVEVDYQLFLNFTLGAALMEMHQVAFSKLEEKILVRLLQNNHTTGKPSKKAPISPKNRDIWHDRLKFHYGKNDKRISLLYSLGYLQLISKIVGDKPIQTRVQSLIRKSVIDVANNLRSEYENSPMIKSKSV